MPDNSLRLKIRSASGEEQIDFRVGDAVVAGWTSRNREAMEKHIAELEALGVARPRATPLFYRVAGRRVTTDTAIEVSGGQSSGEVEFVLFGSDWGLLVGIGSDHTDREVEAYGVTVSKQMCEKPVSSDVWLYEDVADHWDDLMLRAHVVVDGQRTLYQEGPVSAMLSPGDLTGRYLTGEPRDHPHLPPGTVMFCGTLPAHGGVKPAPRFEFEIEDPVLGRTLHHAYDVTELPIVD